MNNYLSILSFLIFFLFFGCEKSSNEPEVDNEELTPKYTGRWTSENISFDVSEGNIYLSMIKILGTTSYPVRNMPDAKIEEDEFEFLFNEDIRISGKFKNNIELDGNYSFESYSIDFTAKLDFGVSIDYQNCSEIGTSNGYITVSHTGLEYISKKYMIDGKNLSDDSSFINLSPNMYIVKIIDDESFTIYSQDVYIFEESNFTDQRDQQTYPILKVGNQLWMTKELKYNTEHSICYDYLESNCEEDGRLYTWVDAMNSETIEMSQGVCIDGWHIPSKSEAQTLLNNYPTGYDINYNAFAKGLTGSGTGLMSEGFFAHKGYGFMFWTSTSSSDVDYAFTFGDIGPFSWSINSFSKEDYLPVLCIKD